MGRRIDPVHPSIRPSVRPSVLRPSIVVLVRSAPLCSAQSAAEEIKFSAGDLFPFSCQRSTASRSRASGDPTVTDGRRDGLLGRSVPHYTKTNYSDPRKKNVSFKF